MSCVRKLLMKGVVWAGMLLLAPLSAMANVVYTHAGPPFFIFNAGSPYTTANKITFSFEVADPLAPNLSVSEVIPLEWSFTDGLQTGSSADPNWSVVMNFNTDVTGVPIGWIVAATSATGFVQFKHALFSGDHGYEFAGITVGEVVGTGRADLDCAGCLPPGPWAVSAVPEPGGLLLWGIGLALVAVLCRRRWEKVQQSPLRG